MSVDVSGDSVGRSRRRCSTSRVRSVRTPRRGRPAARRHPGPTYGGAGRRRPRPAQPHRCRHARSPTTAAVIEELVARVSGFGAAPALPRRPRGRGDLDQRPEPGLRRPQRSARADHVDPHRDRGAGARRADAQVERSPHRPVAAVRRRDAARRAPAPRRPRGHHPRASRRSTSASSSSRQRASTTSSRLGSCRRGPRASSTRPFVPGSTSSSPAARRQARPRC